MKRPAREALGSWRADGPSAAPSCDSSDCAYCQALACLRQPGGAGAASCWLRCKRSRTDLAGMDGGGQGEPEGGSLSRASSSTSAAPVDVPPLGAPLARGSMWDHALLDEAQLRAVTPAAAAAAQRDTPAVTAAAAAAAAAWVSPPAPATARRRSSRGSATGRAAEDSSSDSGAAASSSYSRLAGGSASEWCPSPGGPAELHEVAAFAPALPNRRHQDIVCALEFEEHGWLLASAGVSKQVRVYSLASCLQSPEDPALRQPLRCHRMASKLSSLAWNPDAPGAVTVADYDGVVSQVDMESGHLIAEADEHAGRRVWSVSHSLQRPHLCASASDDGTVRLWAGAGLRGCVAALRPGGGAPATGVHLSPHDGDLAAVACADHSAYVFDLRRPDRALWQLSGHGRAVSYVRWLRASRLATASTDASLAVWQLPGPGQAADAGDGAPLLPATAAGEVVQPWARLRGHRNSKNFVGLSVRPEGGLLACGSEAPACFAYRDGGAAPLASHAFAPLRLPGDAAPPPGAGPASQFCSAVCWQPATARLGGAPLLAAALAGGDLRVLELRQAGGPTCVAA